MKTQNTFSEGLNMDANALVAPNNIMSNCLNGTLITYNGNEGVLQNDMGNGKVHKAYLPAGWVPVGMQEYGGIIYVAAYNPELKQSQIGSFPSPQQSFENSKDGIGELFTELKAGKYKLFTGDNKDMELKPGNKIAISLGYLQDEETKYIPYNEIEPNYNKEYKHKRHWSVQLCLLTSNGLLSDITDKVETLVNEEALEYNQEYRNYFFLQSYVTDQLEKYLRVYDGNLIGSPYIQVIENLASSMDAFITTSYKNNTVKFIVTCNFESNSQLYGYPFNENTNEEGLIGFYYTYTTSNGLQGEGYKQLNNQESLITICKSEEEVENKIEQLINCGISQDNLELRNDFEIWQKSNYSLVEIDAQNYSLTVTDALEISNVNKEDIITLTINPCFSWKNNIQLQKSLEFSQVFDVSKIGTGIHKINQWRYYYDNDFITLTWGMESYPAEGESIKVLQMEFLDYNGTPINFGDTKLEFKYFSYNGEFTQLLETSLFDRIPYIVKLKWIVGGQSMEEDRWIIATPLFNDFYQYKLVKDFYLEWDITEYGKELAKLTTLEEIRLNIVGEPQENIITQDWSDFEAIYLKQSEIKQNVILKSNTYEYQLPIPQVTSDVNSINYPFTMELSNPSKFNITPDETFEGTVIIQDQIIKHTLTKEHHLTYELNPNIKVNKVFETYYDQRANTLNNADSYIAIVTIRENHGGSSRDDNWTLLNVCGNILNGYDNPKTNVSQGVNMEQIILKYEHLDGDSGLSLIDDPEKGDSWDNTITGKLNELAASYLNSKVVIPVMIICKSYGYSLQQQNSTIAHRWSFNWAVHSDDGWVLYWNTPKQWTYTNQNGNSNLKLYNGGLPEEHIDYTETATQYQIINRRFSQTNIPPTIYEARGKYNYLRCVYDESTNQHIEGYLVKNDLRYPSTQDTNTEFSFNVSLEVTNKLIANFGDKLDYNEAVEQFYIPLVLDSQKESFKKQLKFTYKDNYVSSEGIKQTLTKNYQYINIIPGTYDIIQTINNLGLNGIDALVRYSPNNNGDTVYVIPKQELNADIVYKLELNTNGNIIDYKEVNDLGVKKLPNGERHIIPRNCKKHMSLVTSCDSDGRSYTDYTGVPTSNIENIAY